MEDLSLAVAQRLRRFAQDNPKTDLALGFVPGVGQVYGAAQTAASLRDPEASGLEKGMAAASMLPFGKLGTKIAEKIRNVTRESEFLIRRRDKPQKEFDNLFAQRRATRGTDKNVEIAQRQRELFREITDLQDKIDAARVAERNSGSLSFDPTRSQIVVGERGIMNNPKAIIGDFWEGRDKRLRGEISDLYSYVRDEATQAGKMGDLLNHPKLYKAYPELRDIQYDFDRTLDDHVRGKFSPAENLIRLNPNMSPDEVRSTILHELQHGVQDIENYGRGFVGTDSGVAGSFYKYMKDLGETEARVTQQRRNWSLTERKSVAFPDHLAAEQRRLDYIRQQAIDDPMRPVTSSQLAFEWTDRLEQPDIMANYVRRFEKTGPRKPFEQVDPLKLR